MAHSLVVEKIAELHFDIADETDPIEVGGQTAYRIRVANQGTKAATNVQLRVQFPQGLTPLSIDGHQQELRGDQVPLPTIDSLPAGEEREFVVRARGTREGDHRVVVSMQSDDRPTPVSKEESTRVYVDR